MYFQILQLLRIIPLWIRETRHDLDRFLSTSISSIEGFHPGPLGVLHRNRDKVLEHFAAIEQELLRRIDAKTDEIRGLRDGVSMVCNR
jgi:hypothetical protein